MPLLLQIGFGLTAFHSGLLLLATATGNLGMKLFTTPIMRRFGFRPVAIVDVILAAGFIAACGWLTASTPLTVMIVVLLCYGLTRSLQFTWLATMAYADVGDRQKSSASTLWSVAQQMTLGMGIALGALCLRFSAFLDRGQSSAAQAHFSVRDFRWAFSIAGAVVLVSVIGYLKLPRNAGDSVRGR
jgi:MFS family permease